MTTEQFWDIIAASRSDFDSNDAAGNQERQMHRLHSLLSALSPEEVMEFDRIFGDTVNKAYDWNLWGAAYLIEGGCSDDGFEYFRRWLISMGREVYEVALREPDTLADVADQPGIETTDFEEFGYVAYEVYEEKTGRELVDDMPSVPRSSLSGRLSEPAGYGWDHDDEDELRRRFPKLMAKFWEE